MRNVMKAPILLGLALGLLVACKKEAPVEGAASVPDEAAAPVAGSPPQLSDSVETDPRYVVGVSYPPGINKYPGLAVAVDAYVKRERGELMEALAALGNDAPRAPYELSMSFQQLLETPELVAIAGDGSRYTGGAHGDPLVVRMVWLPKQDKLLSVQDLIADAQGWTAISRYAREQLRTAVSVRADADEMSPEERQVFVGNADKMIDAGTEAEPGNYEQFQPVLDTQGKISALRFVFPPYQVGPYSDGVQTVDVPAAVLKPYLAPEYAGLFAL